MQAILDQVAIVHERELQKLREEDGILRKRNTVLTHQNEQLMKQKKHKQKQHLTCSTDNHVEQIETLLKANVFIRHRLYRRWHS